ncbi:MAG: GDSL-type esterase/lipase family protein [Oscillospiraceae bacterium]
MKKTILIYGDSNTYGYAPAFDGRYDENTRWPCLLQSYLGDDYSVIAEGLCGRTAAFNDSLTEGLCGVELVTPILNTHSPISLLIIMLGTNDVKERFSCNARNIAQGMLRLVQKASATPCWKTKPNILIVSPPIMRANYGDLIFGAEMGIGCHEKSAALGEEYRRIAGLADCHFIDAALLPNVVMSEIDGMHLTPEAHAALAKGIADKLTQEADVFGI